MNKSILLIIECILIFLVLPFIFIFDISFYIKLSITLLGFAHIVRITLLKKLFTFPELYAIYDAKEWKNIALKTIFLIIISTLLMYLFNGEKLFIVVRNKPLLWITICCFYSIFSVFPQELLYRSFFFKRYASIFKNPAVFIIINALAFSIAHSLLLNVYICILTFIGGLVFAITYQKTKSILLTSLEHAVYGSWLFTLGIGEYLAFPV